MVDFERRLAEKRAARTQPDNQQEISRMSERNEFLDDETGGMDVDDFLRHSTRGSGGGFLSSDWKTKDGEITIWLHRKHKLHAVWFHNWYRVIEVKSREDGKRERKVVSLRWNCRDYDPAKKNGDKLLRKARFRDDTGAREHAPVLCPFCKFEDWLAVEVSAGRLGFVEPIFRFSPEEDRPEDRMLELPGGGIVGFYVEKNMTSDEKKLVREAKIKLAESWKLKTLVRCNYLLVVVNDAEPEEGPLRFFAADGCGDKIKKAIRDEIGRDKKNPERGNPIVNPYPLRIEYDERAHFDDKYDVSVLVNAALQPNADEEDRTHYREILEQIDGERLDLSQELEPGNCAQLLSDFQAHALIDAPWESFFDEAKKAGLMTVSDTRRKRGASRSDEEDAPESVREPETKAPPVETYRCDFCDGTLHAATNVVCHGCGAVYDEKGALIALACLGCKEKVVVPKTGEQATCKACGQIHAFDMQLANAGTDDEYEKPIWTKVEPKKAEESAAPKRARRTRASAPKEG